jgi:hypothetical protein
VRSSTHFDIAVQHGIFHSVLRPATAGTPHRLRRAVKRIAGACFLSCQHLLLNGIAMPLNLPLDNAFAALPPAFYTRLMPTPCPRPIWSPPARAGSAPRWAWMRRAWPSRIRSLIGNAVAARSQPLAAVYSGHQFGVWAGQLGDGRAILLGDVATAKARWSCS